MIGRVLLNKRIVIAIKAFAIGSLGAALLTVILALSGIPLEKAAHTTVGVGTGISAAIALSGFRDLKAQ